MWLSEKFQHRARANEIEHSGKISRTEYALVLITTRVITTQ